MFQAILVWNRMRGYKIEGRSVDNIDFYMFWFYTLVILLSLAISVFNQGTNNKYVSITNNINNVKSIAIPNYSIAFRDRTK